MTSDPTPLTMLSAVALLAAGVMVAAVRGDITAERYTIARCEQEVSRLERRARHVRVDLVATFASWEAHERGAAGPAHSIESLQPRPEQIPTERDQDWLLQQDFLMADASVAGWVP